MTDSCTLCGLATPDPPVSSAGVSGEYCCQGCLEVARTLDNPAENELELNGRAGHTTATDTSQVRTAPATTFLSVDGMHCAVCEKFLEDRATEQAGVRAAEASYSAELVWVGYDPDAIDPSTIADGLTGSGYQAKPAADEGPSADDTSGRLLVGVIFGFMAMMWYVLFLYPTYVGIPSESLLLDVSDTAGTYVLGTVGVLATVVLAYTGMPLLRGAWVSLRAGRPNMDLLVALAAGTAYIYSVAGLLLGRTEVYFDVAIVIVVVVTIGRRYEERIRRRATDTLSELASARQTTARIRTESGIETIAADSIDSAVEVVVRAGERIPVDGTVLEGTASVDESLVTGESTPVKRGVGDKVRGGSIAIDGRLVVSPVADGESTIDRLLTVLWTVQSQRGGAQRLADRLASVFVPIVVLLAVSVAVIHVIGLGASPSQAVLTGLAVLVVSCPCALGLATPLAVATGVREALDQGIVLADRSAVERITQADIIAMDKTGTLTTGEMSVDRVIGESSGLDRASAVEQYADHPLAQAIVSAGDPGSSAVTDFEGHPGLGVSAAVDDVLVTVGRPELLEEAGVDIPDRLQATYERAVGNGHAAAYVAWNGKARSVIVASGRLRPGWEAVIADLANSADSVVVITGDDAAAAESLEDHPDIDEVFAEVPPEGKAAIIDRLRETGSVAMVGDGTNDAPALATADVGIALGGGADLAGDAADAVITNDELSALPAVFSLTEATRRRIRENLGWAFGYNLTAIPLAATGVLNPLFAAVAMSASSLLVVANSARPLQTPFEQSQSSESRTRSDEQESLSTDHESGTSDPQ